MNAAFPGKVIPIPAGRVPEAARVMGRAFEHDPVMDYFFESVKEPHLEVIATQFGFSGERFIRNRWPLLGVTAGERLAGVAYVIPPEPESVPADESVTADYERFQAGMGGGPAARLDRYDETIAKHAPPQPHFYLMAIGVDPDFQGRGAGSLLMAAVHGLSTAHPRSLGVGLDTENPRNVAWYQHLGYRVTAKTDLDRLDLWCLFRPEPRRAAE